MDHADVKKKHLKTFGKRSVVLDQPSIERSASIDMILGDENEKLQAQINQIHNDLVAKKPKQVCRSDFMTELDNLSSDEEFDQFAYGIRRPKNVKSVHELVEAGENSRFFDEIEYLVEGLCSGSEESRTLSLEELTHKVFCSTAFGSRMRAHGKLTMTIERSFGLVHKARVRECLALLLINLCHDLRKLDAFITLKSLVVLSKHLLYDESDLPAKNFAFLKQTQVFKDLPFEKCPVRVLGLWLLAKVCQWTSQTSTKEEVKNLKELLSSSAIEQKLIDLVSSTCQGIDEFGCLQLRWSLVPLQFGFVEVLLDNAKWLVRTLSNIDYTGSQMFLLALDLARLLVFLSGPDNYQQKLSKNAEFVQLLSEAIVSIIARLNEDAVPVSICLVSTLVNLVDRSKDLCRRLGGSNVAVSIAGLYSSLSPELKIHVGLLLAFLVKVSDDSQKLLSIIQPSELSRQVCIIMEQYRCAGQLTPALEMTFIELVERLDLLA